MLSSVHVFTETDEVISVGRDVMAGVSGTQMK